MLPNLHWGITGEHIAYSVCGGFGKGCNLGGKEGIRALCNFLMCRLKTAYTYLKNKTLAVQHGNISFLRN